VPHHDADLGNANYLALLSLGNLDLQVLNNVPSVQFTVAAGHSLDTTFDYGAGVGIGVANDYQVVIQKFDEATGQWTNLAGDGDATLLNLTLLNGGIVADEMLGEGTYRAFVTYDGGLGLSILGSLTVSGTDYDYGTVSGSTSVSGNVITDQDMEGHSDTVTDHTILSEVAVNGVTTEVGVDGATISGEFGTLLIHQDGSYTYTPTVGAPGVGETGATETFTYTIEDPDTGASSSAHLTIGIAPVPDETAPTLATELDVSDDGETLNGHGEAGSVVTVYDENGAQLGTGTVNADGTFDVSLDTPKVLGEDLTVTLTDASGNISDAAPVTAPFDVIAFDNEASADIEMASHDTDLGSANYLLLLSLGNVDLQLLNNVANVAFDVAEGTTLDGTFQYSAAIGIGVANDFQVIIQREDPLTHEWTAVGGGSEATLLNLNLLNGGIVGELNLEAGHYRAFVTYNGGLGINALGSLHVTGQVLAHDVITGTDPVSGNVITDPDGDGTDVVNTETHVTSIMINGVETAVGVDGVTVEGQYGTLHMNADGSYSYTPHSDIAALNQTEEITYTIANPDSSAEATLSIHVNPAPDTTSPTTASELAVSGDGLEVGGHGEVGTTVHVLDENGAVIGTDTVAADGSFTVTLDQAQTLGQDLTVTLTDMSGNVSMTTSVEAPFDVIASDDHATAAVGFTTTDVDLGSQTYVALLSEAPLLSDVDPQATTIDRALVFDVQSGHDLTTTFTVDGLLTPHHDDSVVVVQMLNPDTGQWTGVDGTGDYTTIPLNGDYDPVEQAFGDGHYRAFFAHTEPGNIFSGAYSGTFHADGIDVDHSGLAIDAATGNVITDVGIDGHADQANDETHVASVTINGVETAVGADGVTVEGQYGTLEMHADGSYTYVPHSTEDVIGQTETIDYTITNPDSSETATLTVSIGDVADNTSLASLASHLGLMDTGTDVANDRASIAAPHEAHVAVFDMFEGQGDLQDTLHNFLKGSSFSGDNAGATTPPDQTSNTTDMPSAATIEDPLSHLDLGDITKLHEDDHHEGHMI
jgi:VCBS repeat-containing protein